MTKIQNSGRLFSIINNAKKLSDLREIKAMAREKEQEIRNILKDGNFLKFHVEEIEKAILKGSE